LVCEIIYGSKVGVVVLVQIFADAKHGYWFEVPSVVADLMNIACAQPVRFQKSEVWAQWRYIHR